MKNFRSNIASADNGKVVVASGSFGMPGRMAIQDEKFEQVFITQEDVAHIERVANSSEVSDDVVRARRQARYFFSN